tara:strand:+ start:495 stop:893 length:399 start_codon:yes stop_codon:yes gene_type:complete
MFFQMIRKLILVLSLVAAISTSGIPLALVQVGAWANMFDQFYEGTESILTSAKWTLDGNHRCQGCEFVSENRNSEESLSASKISSEKLTLVFSSFELVSIPRLTSPQVSSPAFSLPDSAFVENESPPPRISS